MGIAVVYDGVKVGMYQADVVVEGRLILELKAVSALVARHEAQLVNYLAATGMDDGLLLNFGAPSLQFKHKYRLPKGGKGDGNFDRFTGGTGLGGDKGRVVWARKKRRGGGRWTDMKMKTPYEGG